MNKESNRILFVRPRVHCNVRWLKTTNHAWKYSSPFRIGVMQRKYYTHFFGDEIVSFAEFGKLEMGALKTARKHWDTNINKIRQYFCIVPCVGRVNARDCVFEILSRWIPIFRHAHLRLHSAQALHVRATDWEKSSAYHNVFRSGKIISETRRFPRNGKNTRHEYVSVSRVWRVNICPRGNHFKWITWQ